MIDETTESEVDRAADFALSHRRPDALLEYVVQGFGLGRLGQTLHLPSPRADNRYAIVNGEPIRQTLGSCFVEPELAAARVRCLEELRDVGGPGHAVDLALMRYATVMLRRNYSLSDEELTELLKGTRWHMPVGEHLIGGDDMLPVAMELAQRRPRHGGSPIVAAATPSADLTPTPADARVERPAPDGRLRRIGHAIASTFTRTRRI